LGKHFQLIVPDYDKTGTNNESPLSYFRLGAAFDGTEATLLSSATRRGDDMVWKNGGASENDRLAFKDDWRDPVYEGGGKPYTRDDGIDRGSETRANMSAELLTRGGWRDHTDGNRISTTRGDSVEVIQGNYKLIVMGRVASAFDPSGLGDATTTGQGLGRTRQEISSGGHYNESTSTPGEVMSITWCQDHEDGTWKSLEQTDSGDVKSIYKGWVYEEYFGPSITTTVGCGTSEIAIEALKGGSPNTSSAGAHGAEKPDIKNVTYARSMDSEDHFRKTKENTNVTGDITVTTHVKTEQIDKEVWKKVMDISLTSGFSEHLVATKITTRDAFGGWRRNYTIGGIHLGIAAVAETLVWRKGYKVSTKLAATFSASAHVANIALNLGLFFIKLRIGSVTDISVGSKFSLSILDMEINLAQTEAKVAELQEKGVGFNLFGSRVQLHAVNKEG
jgi:hypothetical protein